MPDNLLQHLLWGLASSAFVFVAMYVALRYGWLPFRRWCVEQERHYYRALNQQLLLDIPPRGALTGTFVGMAVLGVGLWIAMASFVGFVIGMAVGWFVPSIFILYQERKRRDRLEAQLVDGIVTLASGVRAGLNLVQAMELLTKNAGGPIKQEFAQLLREYHMGLELNQAMRNASDRIGLSNYRLLFTAVEMHRRRGGDTGESLDRIAESIREIQRLEGKLDAVTAQGRSQARMMAMSAVVIAIIYWVIDPTGVTLLFTEPAGRVILLIAALLVLMGFLWIQKIMAVDI